MMKRTLALFLALLMALSLVGCSNTPSGVMTKEEMLDQAIGSDAMEISKDTGQNVAAATQAYCEKIILIRCWVGEICADHVQLETGTTRFKVYLPVEDLANLESRQYVTIVGQTGSEITTEPLGPGIPQDVYVYEVSPAYFVTDRYEYTGTPINENDSFPGAWNVEFPGDSYLKLVYFDESIDVSQYDGKEITFTAKYFYGNRYHDAVIVE